MHKKGFELTFATMAVAIIMLIVVVVVIAVFTDLFGQESNIISRNICNLEKNYDNDDKRNFNDPCPCDKDFEPKEDSPCPTAPNDCKELLKKECA
jgi:hypothetical protein